MIRTPDLLRDVTAASPPEMRRVLAYAVALLYGVAAGVFTLALGPAMERNLFLLFYAAVCAAAISHGVRPALLTLASTLIGLDWWFMAPIADLGIASPLERVRMGVYTVMALVIVALAEALRRARARAGARERALTASERWYRVVLEEAADAILICNADGRYLEVNERACALTGRSRDALLSTNVADLFTAESLTATPLKIGELSPGRRIRVDRELARPNGEIVPVEINATMLDDGRVLAIARDLSERRALQDRMMHSQKMEAVGRLAGGVAHDLNNILTVVTTYSELLLSSNPAQWDVEDVREISKAADRASALTRKLLAFSRKQILKPEILEIDGVIRDADGMLRAMIGPEIQLEMHLASRPWRATADRGQLEQVIINLVVNARDAMPQGGRLRIATGRRLIDMMTEDGIPRGEYVSLTVSDTGVGMDAETMRQIFEPFFTTKAPGRGTGLGLATVYGIVAQSEGHIRVRSTPGQGASFTVMLPRARRTVSPSPLENQSADDDVRPRQATILVVDDESSVLSVTERILTAHGHRVLSAGGPVEAITQSHEWNGEIDLLLTDLRMPVMSGRELAERLRGERPELAVLFMSGYSEDPVVRSAIGAARARLVSKPFTSADLIREVTITLQEAGFETPASPRLPATSRPPAGVR